MVENEWKDCSSEKLNYSNCEELRKFFTKLKNSKYPNPIQKFYTIHILVFRHPLKLFINKIEPKVPFPQNLKS